MEISFRFSRIPGPISYHSTQSTTLAGVVYVIGYDWVQRWGRWTISLSTINGDPLLSGVCLTQGVDLLADHRVRESRLPPGFLLTSGSLDVVEGGFSLVYVENV